MMTQTLKIAALTLAVSAALPATANAFVLNFDGIANGADANTDAVAVANGISFHEATFIPDKDGFGDVIPGSEKWQIDPSGGSVVVRDPSTFAGGFYGSAPSGPNALDAREAPILMTFANAINLGTFSVTLDNSTLGNAFPVDVLFLDANKAIIGSISTTQSQPGFVGVLGAPIVGVKEVVLNQIAYYDNITVAAVPLPAPLFLLGSAFASLVGAARRRRDRCS